MKQLKLYIFFQKTRIKKKLTLLLKPILNSPSKLQLLAAELEIMLYVRSGNVNDAYTKIKNLLKRPDISLEQKSRLELLNKIYISNAK